MNDLLAFEEFRRSPSPESLVALLRAHQDGVFTVCLHVLHHPQDAEDAAQEALLKIASGAGKLIVGRAFKSWLYRVVHRTAIDHLRRRQARRRIESGRAAVMDSPLSENGRAALHEVLIQLPDEERLLLVEHYFEKVSLEELGRRDGMSKVAVWKRLEKAKERLKRGLIGAGFLVGASQVSQALESVTPATAPASLIGSAITSKAALVAAGGTAVGAKLSMSSIALVAILFLAIGGAGGFLVGGGRTRDSRRVRELEDRVAELSKPAPQAPVISNRTAAPPIDAKAPAPAAKNKLTATLDKYKELKDRHNAKWKAWSAANPGKGINPQELSLDFNALAKELEGIRDQIFEDPETFLDFLARPENRDYVWNLFDVALARRVDGSIMQQPFSALPAPLAEGLLALMQSGSDTVRDQILRFMQGVTGQPDEFKRQYLAMLSDSNTNFIGPAARALACTSPLTPEEFTLLTTLCENAPTKQARRDVVSAMFWIQTPESCEWQLSTLESGRMPDADAQLASGLIRVLYSGASEEFEERFSRAVAAALARPADEATYLQLLQASPRLPSSKWKTHFELAAAHAPTSKVREAAVRCLELIAAKRADRKSLATIVYEAQTKN